MPEETRAERRAARQATRIERRTARKLERTRLRAVRLGRKLDPRLPEDMAEIEALAAVANMETRELIAEADYVGAPDEWHEHVLRIVVTLFQSIEIDDDTIEAVAEAIDRAIDIPGIPDWAEGWIILSALRALWSALDKAIDAA